MENRMLAEYPSLFLPDGKLNEEYITQYETWLNDNLRGRGVLVKVNSTLQYRLFHRIVKSDTIEGQEHWLFANDPEQIMEYQHLNLLSEDNLNLYASKMQGISDYLKERGVSFYYFQCYDKETIYPEKYVAGINQIGTVSRTDQILNALQEQTDVKQISVKEMLLEHADEKIYFHSTDLMHWNMKGAYLGYQAIIQELQKDYDQIPLLGESDFLITERNETAEIYGFPYPCSESNPIYSLKEPRAAETTNQTTERWDFLHYKEHTHSYINESCENKLRILILGDSFVRMYIKDKIAESFYETLSIDWLNIPILDKVVDEYQPDIVIIESDQSALDNTIELITQVEFIGT
ncbi:MAG: hypothetical protein NC429_02120 [Lachnospiraceae bacterium]|nr:hypothetical protein [Lachnospiraceae bacterium]